MIDRKHFYTVFRKQRLKLLTKQLNGIEAVLNEWERQGLTDIRWLAYMLATDYHETGATMQPIREIGRGKGLAYGSKVKHSGVRYLTPNVLFYGRGLVQLTWYDNYLLMGRLLGIDLLNNPDKALEMDTAVKIMFEGMLKGSSSFGDFTGKSLEQYFNNKVCDPIRARRIINGNDRAELIAGYYYDFMECLGQNRATAMKAYRSAA